jgi:hypothetical protein
MALINASFNPNATADKSESEEEQDKFEVEKSIKPTKLKVILNKVTPKPKMQIFSKFMNGPPGSKSGATFKFMPNPTQKNYLKKPSEGWSPWSPDASKSNLMKKHTAKIFDKIPTLVQKKSIASTQSSSGDDYSDTPAQLHQSYPYTVYNPDKVTDNESLVSYDSEYAEESNNRD